MATRERQRRFEIVPMTEGDLDGIMQVEKLAFRAPWSRQVFIEELDREWAHVDVLKPRVPDAPVIAFVNYWLVRDEVHVPVEMVGFISLTPRPDNGLRSLGRIEDMARVLDVYRVQEVIIADPDFPQELAVDLVDTCHQRGVTVRVAPSTMEILVQRAEFVPGASVPLFELRPPVFDGVVSTTYSRFIAASSAGRRRAEKSRVARVFAGPCIKKSASSDSTTSARSKRYCTSTSRPYARRAPRRAASRASGSH